MQIAAYKNIPAYIASFPSEIQTKLQQIYQAIKKAAPQTTEAIKYGMPTFVANKNLVHFAWCQKHIGFYPAPSAVSHFHKELAIYKTSKGAVQFPLNKPLPLQLIAEMTHYRVLEDAMKAKTKKKY